MHYEVIITTPPEAEVTQVVKQRLHDSKVHDFNQNVNTYDKARMSQWFKDCAIKWREGIEHS